MSAHFKRNLIHKCQVQRNTPTRSTSGEVIPSWADVNPAMRCRYVQKSESIANESLGFMMKQGDLLLVQTGEDVLEADRITDIVEYSDESVVVAEGPFEIESVLNRSSTKAHHISLRLEGIE